MKIQREKIIQEAQIMKTGVIETMNTAQTWELMRSCAEVLFKIRIMEKDLLKEMNLSDLGGNTQMESI